MTPNPRKPVEPASSGSPRRERNNRYANTFNLPGISVQFDVPKMGIPRPVKKTAVVAAKKAQALIPPPKQVAFYVGLGALAALDVIAWPVAVVVGTGTALARRSGGSGTPEPADTNSADIQEARDDKKTERTETHAHDSTGR
ncbi:hypothetical protein [Amycolatopsis anabasis]|uniref:hypothetical protein n=1 Tax=Amycolatopsis anabasis TaxID=1840409 RepID=UPI00131A7213|nr:hypothetical protein [Amycolatopsis anabasis]